MAQLNMAETAVRARAARSVIRRNLGNAGGDMAAADVDHGNRMQGFPGD